MNNYNSLSLNDLDNEIWKDITGYEGLYQVSNYGRVKKIDSSYRNINKKRILSQTLSKTEYYYVYLRNTSLKRRSVHRLLAIHFIPNPNNYPEINHINGIRNDNRIENLEWCNHQQNILHARRVLKKGVGVNHYRAKFNTEQIKDIKEKHTYYSKSIADLAKEYSVTSSTIKRIIDNKSYVYF